MSSQDMVEGRNGAKREPEMLQTALSAVCQVAATHGHVSPHKRALLEL